MLTLANSLRHLCVSWELPRGDGEEEEVASDIRSEVDRRNGALCRFIVDRTLHIGSASFASKAEAQGTPLVEKLFEIEGLTDISLIGKMLVATKL